MYSRFLDTGVVPYPPPVALAPRVAANQRSAREVRVSTP